jgi:hypothetical protein
MKKAFKLVAFIVMVAMIAAMAIVPATAAEEWFPEDWDPGIVITEPVKNYSVVIDGEELMIIGFFDNPGVFEIRSPAAGVGPGKVGTWAFAPFAMDRTSAKTTGFENTSGAFTLTPYASDELEVAGAAAGSIRVPNTGDNVGNFAVAYAFDIVGDGNRAIATVGVTGEGNLRVVAGLAGTGATGASLAVNVDIVFTNAAAPDTTAETTTREPFTGTLPTQPQTTARRPSGGNNPPATTVATTAATTPGGVPKGGVALAIIPTIMAAGAAIVASKRKRK